MNQRVTKYEAIELHPKEVALIKAIRSKYRYGEMTLMTRDGLPFRLKRVEEFDDLDSAGQL